MNQKELTEELVTASEAYYNTGSAVMSDLEFDRKVEELRDMEAESGIVLPGSPTQNVGAAVRMSLMDDDEEFLVVERGESYAQGRIVKTKVDGLKKARHEQPALSLDKVKYKDRESLKKWLGNRQAVLSWKCDGLTLVLTYDNGLLTSAVTRGDGTEGSDVTHNAHFFKGIPQKIAYKGHLVVRGEAMMAYAEFERVNSEANGIYENPRNLAAATIQMLDAKESSRREIIFKAFELVTPEPMARIEGIAYGKNEQNTASFSLMYMQDRLNMLEALGFDVVRRECCNASDILQKIEEWKEDVQNLPYPTDGLVISYNDLVEGWALGSTGHHPRWAMALKWTDETYTTTIRDIEWSVGKTGIITPVAVFDPVRMGLGSTVTRASLHNLSVMQHLSGQAMIALYGVDVINCEAEVYMANLIIPQVAVIKRSARAETVQVPTTCPVCGSHTEISTKNGVGTLHCTNHEGCPAQQIGKLMNTFSKDGLFVKGLGESQIEDLLNARLVTADPVSFYDLANEDRAHGVYPKESEFTAKVGALLEKDGWGQKKWDNLIDAINASRETTLQKFLYSLNIPLLGNDLSKKLVPYFKGDPENFMYMVSYSASYKEELIEELTQIEGVGQEKAKNIAEWAAAVATDEKKYRSISELIKELKFPEVTNGTPDSSLEGLTFVITGSVHEYKNRDEFKASVEARGGKVAGSVSAKTSYLVNNDVESTSGKNRKAKELGIEIISEDEFIARFSK